MIDLDALAKMAEIATPVGSVMGLGWWLRGKFSDVKDHATALLSDHEKTELDRFDVVEKEAVTRHEQNLRRFAIIGIALAKIKPDLDLSNLSRNGS